MSKQLKQFAAVHESEDGTERRSRADKAAIIEATLIESKAALESGIRAMRGKLGYYVGIDRRNNAMSNVSHWESVEAAEHMATFQVMNDLRFLDQRPSATVWSALSASVPCPNSAIADMAAGKRGSCQT